MRGEKDAIGPAAWDALKWPLLTFVLKLTSISQAPSLGVGLVPRGRARLAEGDARLIELSTLGLPLTALPLTAYRNNVAYRLPRLPRLPLTGASAYRLPLTARNL